MNNKIAKQNYINSRVDYSQSFIVLWASFNGQYNQNSNKKHEIDRITDFVTVEGVFTKYLEGLIRIANPEDRKIKYLLAEVEILSNREGIDSNGNKQLSHIDTTGTKYKIISDNSDVHTIFLKSAISVPPKWLSSQGELISGRISLFFDIKNNKSLFDRVYYDAYHPFAANYLPWQFDAVKHIPLILSRLEILQYGEILFSNTRINFLTALSNIDTWVLTNEDTYDEFQSKNAMELLKLELSLLYGFRCALAHGDIDFRNEKVNNFAKKAYEALDDIIGTIL